MVLRDAVCVHFVAKCSRHGNISAIRAEAPPVRSAWAGPALCLEAERPYVSICGAPFANPQTRRRKATRPDRGRSATCRHACDGKQEEVRF